MPDFDATPLAKSHATVNGKRMAYHETGLYRVTAATTASRAQLRLRSTRYPIPKETAALTSSQRRSPESRSMHIETLCWLPPVRKAIIAGSSPPGSSEPSSRIARHRGSVGFRPSN